MLDVRHSTLDVVRTEKMIGNLTAEEVRALLKLEPHATCGFVPKRPTASAHFQPGRGD